MYHVLVADDEPIERMVISKKIQKFFPGQMKLFLAENGRQAVQIFEEEKCKILFLDIEMPGINGLEAAEQIRKKDKDVSIIFLTAFDEFNYAKKAIGVHALDYLLKPSVDEEVISVLEEAMCLADNCEEKKQLAEAEAEVEQKVSGFTEQHSEYSLENIRLNAVGDMILSYIETHYKEDIALQDVAGALKYSDAYFCKIFKQCFDKSFTTYLSEYRIEKAKKMLEDVSINIKDISVEIGYRDSNYFAKVFKRIVGVTPSEYRFKALEGYGQRK